MTTMVRGLTYSVGQLTLLSSSGGSVEILARRIENRGLSDILIERRGRPQMDPNAGRAFNLTNRDPAVSYTVSPGYFINLGELFMENVVCTVQLPDDFLDMDIQVETEDFDCFDHISHPNPHQFMCVTAKQFSPDILPAGVPGILAGLGAPTPPNGIYAVPAGFGSIPNAGQSPPQNPPSSMPWSSPYHNPRLPNKPGSSATVSVGGVGVASFNSVSFKPASACDCGEQSVPKHSRGKCSSWCKSNKGL